MKTTSGRSRVVDLYHAVCDAIGAVRRAGQEELLVAVDDAIEGNGTLVAEAAPGIGKSIAYLIPALASGRRVIVSTATKALQSQLVESDVPIVRGVLLAGSHLSVAILKGRSNYLCLAKVRKDGRGSVDAELAVRLRELCSYDDFDGDLASLHRHGISAVSALEFVTDTVECVGPKDCRYGKSCFFERAVMRASQADVVVTNHHLLAWVVEVLAGQTVHSDGDYPVLIVDEAHRLEDALRAGAMISRSHLLWLIHTVGRELGISDRAKKAAKATAKAFVGIISRAFDNSDGGAFLLGKDAPIRARQLGLFDDSGVLEEAQSEAGRLVTALGALEAEAKSVLDEEIEEIARRSIRNGEETSIEVKKGRLKLLTHAIDVLKDAVDIRHRDSLAWLEVVAAGASSQPTGRSKKRAGRSAAQRDWRIRIAPLDVRGSAEAIFSRASAVILTSGTLCDSTGFERIASTLGLELLPQIELTEDRDLATGGDGDSTCPDGTRYLKIPSPYDLCRQALLYCPVYMPGPDDPGWPDAVVEEVAALVRMVEGGSLVLFTSLKAMAKAYEKLDESLPDHEILVQGSDSPQALQDRFAHAEKQSVLLASRTFWEGIDFPGPSVRLVAIDRLPFPPPRDPLVAALCSRIEAEGGSPFLDYSLPHAVSSFRQGLGRLIRNEDDYGVVAVLDGRLYTRRYGAAFLEAAHPIPLAIDRAQVVDFLESRKAAEHLRSREVS